MRGDKAAPATIILLVLLSLAGCGPRFIPPVVDPAELGAARQVIIGTPPAAGMASAPEALLDGVSRRLTRGAQPLCTAYGSEDCTLQVTLDPSRAARAAMSGQGRVTITLGLLELLGSEDEVAAVLGHELGHQLANHLGRRRARGLAASTMAGTLLGAVVPFGGLAGWALGEGAALAGSQGAQLAFSKAEEREADYLGAYLVARAGYDLDRASLVWVRLTRGGPLETTGLLDSHPAGPERLAAWRQATAEIRLSSSGMPQRFGQRNWLETGAHDRCASAGSRRAVETFPMSLQPCLSAPPAADIAAQRPPVGLQLWQEGAPAGGGDAVP
ncbi:M48 family metalloprotease [Dankookia sp. GCM10030260]|uniref:M48 family metalloprotease n=1 Tax=Dankookia sp. GCM10030260 TaxID=3273390 RepID=UPI00360EC519